MSAATRRIGLACSEAMAERCMIDQLQGELAALGSFAQATFEEPTSWTEEPPFDPAVEARMIAFARDLDALIIGPGAPKITDRIMAACPRLKLIGEIEGDRFARRIDMAAAAAHGIQVSDTTQGSSFPVAEWALAMMLIGLRNAGELFRRLVDGEVLTNDWKKAQVGYRNGELTGRTVGLIGCGYIGRHLLKLLAPFDVEVLVHDPHAPRVIADIYDVSFTSLDQLMATSDVVVCLAPLTAETRGMIGARQLGLLRPETVLVNVSRGAVIDSAALIARLRQGDITACLDVFDPEPIPADSPIRAMRNVFMTPHIAGVTADCGPRFVRLMIEEIERHFQGHELRHVLKPREPQAAAHGG